MPVYVENSTAAKVSQTLCISETSVRTTVCRQLNRKYRSNAKLCAHNVYNLSGQKLFRALGLLDFVLCTGSKYREVHCGGEIYIYLFTAPASSSFPRSRNVSGGIKDGFYLFSGRPSLCCALNRARLRWWSPLRLMLTCKIFEYTIFTYFHAQAHELPTYM